MAASTTPIVESGPFKMSLAAANRLLTEGLYCFVEGDDATYNRANHPLHQLRDLGVKAVVGVNIDLRHHLSGGRGNPEYFANFILQKVLTLKGQFEAQNPGKPWMWGIKNNSIGAPSDWNDGPDELPEFVSHPLDTVPGFFSSRRMVPFSHGFGTWTVRVVSGATANSFVIDATSTGNYRGREWINQWEPTYLTENPAFYFQWTTGPNAGTVHRVSGWDVSTGRITLNSTPGSAIANGHEGRLYSIISWAGQADGCLFFKNGSAEMEAWTRRWMAEWVRLGAPALVGDPVMYVVTAEDTHIPGWSSQSGRQFQANLASPQATDPSQWMDPEGHTLAEYVALFAKDKTGAPINMDSNGSMFSPQSGAQNEFLHNLYFTAHGYWFQRGHFNPLKELWPNCLMCKYKIPNPVVTDFSRLLPRPLSEQFADRDVGGRGTMDIGTSFFDHYILPISAFRATLTVNTGTVTTSGHSPTTTQFKVVDDDTTNNPITSKANDYWNGKWQRFDSGPLARTISVISDWDTSTDVVTVPALPSAPTNGVQVSFLQESGTLIQEFNAGIGWDIYASFVAWADQDMDAAGLIETAKRWVSHITEITALKYPDVRQTSFMQTLGDTGDMAAVVPFDFRYSWPEPEFDLIAGYLDRDDWADLILRQYRLGQNVWVWFQPSRAGQADFADDWNGNASVIAHAMTAVANDLAANRDTLREMLGRGGSEKPKLTRRERLRRYFARVISDDGGDSL